MSTLRDLLKTIKLNYLDKIFKVEAFEIKPIEKRDQFNSKEIITASDDPDELDPENVMPNASFFFYFFCKF